jgi:hypothetical protein
MRWRGMNYRYMCVIFYWGCRFDSFLLRLVSVPYYIQTSSAPSPCSPCNLSLLACRSLCIIVSALDICVRPPFSAFCTHITLRRRSKRFRRFKRWVWSPCGTHSALMRPTGRQRSPPCGTHFFFAMNKEGQGSEFPQLSPIWVEVPPTKRKPTPTPKKYERSHWASHPENMSAATHGSRVRPSNTATADFAAQPLHNPSISLAGN